MAELSIADITEDGEENKMEITRNPFDSNLCDKDNYPGLDASVFTQTATPERDNEEFRWSVGQIALLNPAELDPYPNQEYSISYSRKEDEIKDQEAVNEYFQNVLLPSPWLEENGEVLKRVTFSPHPPAMRYINDNNNSVDSHDGSAEHTEKEEANTRKAGVRNVVTMSDACCQTRVTIPMNFDLEALLDKQFCSYTENSGEGKDLMISTLRRKLFEQEDNDNITSTAVAQNCVTSSPRKRIVSPVNSSPRSMLDSSSISPVKKNSSGSSMSVFNYSDEYSPKCASNVGSPSFAHNVEMSLASVDVSPIGSCEKKYVDHHDNCSFMPEVSFDINESDGVKESSRAIKFESPNVSPIQNSKNVNSQASVDTAMDSMEFREYCISVKESTAQNPHAFSGIDISCIGNGTNRRIVETKSDGSSLTSKSAIIEEDNENAEEEKLEVKGNIEDDGPLDITELCPDGDELGTEKSPSYNCSYTTGDESVNNETDADTSFASVKWVDANTPETVMPFHISKNSKSNNDDHTPVLTMKMLEKKQSSSDSCSPLKGILKKSDSVTPTRPLFENSTRYNTLCNSGKKRPVPTFSDDSVSHSTNSDNRPKLNLNRSLSDEFNLESDLASQFKCDRVKVIDHLSTHDGLVSLRANDVLRRAASVVKRCDQENAGKENKSPLGNSQELSPNDVYLDSGIGSMEWCNDAQKDGSKKISPYFGSSAITPLMRLTNKLNITDNVPTWSAKKSLQDSGKYSNSVHRYSVTRTSTFLNKTRSFSATPKSSIPRSRVVPSRCRSEMTTLKRIQSDYQYGCGSVLSAYKDLLPSPLK